MPMPHITLPYTTDNRDYREIDRKTKTEAIKEARSGLVGIEEMIERAINDNPPRFDPKEAREVRSRFSMLSGKLENALALLAQERDEFEQLNFHVRKVSDDLAATKKQLKDAQEKQAYWYTDAMKRRRLMENEGLKCEGD